MANDDLWIERYRASSVTLPMWARDVPERCAYASNATGVWQVYAWDRETGAHRQVTDRPKGTAISEIDPAGHYIWWFADNDGDETGLWMRQPFSGGADRIAVPGLEPSYRAGLVLGKNVAVIGRSGKDGVIVHVSSEGAEPFAIYRHRNVAFARALSHDDTLIAIEHSEHGDMKHPAVRVMDSAGHTVGELYDGPGKGLRPVRFAPVAGDTRLLVSHERRGRPELLVWDPVAGSKQELELDLKGDLVADWFCDAQSLLVTSSHHARDHLFRYDLTSRALAGIDSPRGSIAGARPRPDGTVWFSWSSFAEPPRIRSTDGDVVLAPPGPLAPGSVTLRDEWVPGPGGDVHALVAQPTEEGPFPTVFEVHGGPIHPFTDAFDPGAAAWVDRGCAVIFVNYRGSDGYGSAWRDALHERIGFIETEDISAVRQWAIETGLADPDKLVIAGASWGGYLALFGLGTQPDDWAAGIAAVPIASSPEAWEDATEILKESHACLFGGTPTEVPERYHASSPLTYIEDVRVPVLIIAGENDPRCPIRQIEIYVERLRILRKSHEVYRFDAGHGSYVKDERIAQRKTGLDFIRKHLGV